MGKNRSLRSLNRSPLLKVAEEFFFESFKSRGELGASVSVWQDGREILSLAGGFIDRKKTRPWTAETPVLVWSATKGPAAACLLHALEREGVSLTTPVSVFWPEFKQAAKDAVTFADVLSHRAGLPALDASVLVQDHQAVAAALAKQYPYWALGEGHGYHPRTFGSLLDELVRRVAGMPLGQYWQTYFAVPLGLDFWIGLPPERHEYVAPIYPPKANAPQRNPDFYQAFLNPESLTARSFSRPGGLESVASMNTPEARSTSLPAFGGIGTARALAKFYAMLASGGALEGVRVFQSTAPMSITLVNGLDRVLLGNTSFSAGFMRDPVDGEGLKMRQLFGPSLTAFGQPGAGGSHAFADPENGISFAYVMNQMEPGVTPSEKSMGIVKALYGIRAGK